MCDHAYFIVDSSDYNLCCTHLKLVNTLVVDMFGPPMCMLDCCICLTKMSEPKLVACAYVLPVVVCYVLAICCLIGVTT